MSKSQSAPGLAGSPVHTLHLGAIPTLASYQRLLFSWGPDRVSRPGDDGPSRGHRTWRQLLQATKGGLNPMWQGSTLSPKHEIVFRIEMATRLDRDPGPFTLPIGHLPSTQFGKL